MGGIQYTDGTLDFLQHAEGHYLFTTSAYQYNLTDHLGNVRVTVDATGAVVQRDDYYPFGLSFNSYTSGQENLYKFQGQEHQDETGWDSFKWRNSDPALGRFFNIDPMSEAFYYNSPYAFSENKVTTHVELEGLEAYFIHGTASGPDMWTDDLANFIKRTVTTNTTYDIKFRWNYQEGPRKKNWLLNNESDRLRAAKSLVMHIENTYDPEQHITLIGHSHGGNVAIQAAKLLWEKYHISVEIVNFNTPAYNEQFDAENPNDNWGIDRLTHFYTVQDGVAGGLAGSDKYNAPSGNVANIQLNNPLQTGLFTAHYMDNVNRDEVAEKAPKKKKGKSKRRKTIWPQDR
ncbi:MAG: hypothetical protein OEY56_07720 [Cyclobacteriaceae bacterium]|nr:hypothetical protein [Cyclobacteriaceae bacterium]